MNTNTYTVVIESLPHHQLTCADFIPVSVAALVGAAAALAGNYLLERRSWRRDMRRERALQLESINTSVNRTLIALFSRHNSLYGFQQQIDEHRNSEERWLNLPVNPKHEDLTRPLDMTSLEFLLREDRDPNLLVQLMMLDKNYFMLWRTLERRNLLKMQLHTTPQAISPASNTRAALVALTDHIYSETDRLITEIDDARIRLRSVTLAAFPQASLIDFVVPANEVHE